MMHLLEIFIGKPTVQRFIYVNYWVHSSLLWSCFAGLCGVFEAIFQWVIILPPLDAPSFTSVWYYRTKNPYSASALARIRKALAKTWNLLWDF